jgi:hypothetical protein
MYVGTKICVRWDGNLPKLLFNLEGSRSRRDQGCPVRPKIETSASRSIF